MRTSLRGIRFIEGFEGFSPFPYDDGTGVTTIGYGTTAADISPLPSHLSREQAEALLVRKLAEKYEPVINSLPIKWNQNEFDGFVSFIYNVGPGGVSESTQVGRDIRARQIRSAADAILDWDHAGGHVLEGLRRRREAERSLILTPVVNPPDYSIFNPGPRGRYERETVEEFDRLYPHRHLHEWTLHKLQQDIVILRKLVWRAHKYGTPPGWNVNNRGARWQELNRRARLPL
jgi:lysozyme